MSFWILLAVVLLTGVFLYMSHSNKKCQTNICNTIHNITAARDLLKHSTLVSRAKRNERLIRAFKIDNSFTTSSQTRHREFMQEVKLLLRTTDDQWAALSKSSSIILSHLLLKPNSNINISETVQILTFKTVLLNFFPRAVPVADKTIVGITRSINELWIVSKHKNSESELMTQQTRLFDDLQLPFPDQQINGTHNPLNIILPAYETLWRVVLRCFVEVRFHSSPSNLKLYTQLLDEFMRCPSLTALERKGLGTQMNVKCIVDEALRLYPPTRRIHRDLGPEDGVQAVDVDVEAIQRDPAVWGDDAGDFRPERWVEEGCEGDERKKSFMPFGDGAFVCPAKTAVAPMMIALLVGVLTGSFGRSWKLVDGGGREVEVSEGCLCNGRMAMAEWRLVSMERRFGVET